MALVEPGYFHRLALAVDDAGAANKWFEEVLGAGPVGELTTRDPERLAGGGGDEADLEGADTRMFRLGGYPFILLSKGLPGGPIHKFLERYGPGVHSVAWEVDDMWTVQNLLIERGVRIGAVNITGRHFFMHPRDTHSLLMEWTDDSFGYSKGRPDTGKGVIAVDDLAWVTAVVTDAEATAAFLTDLTDATPVEGNARGPKHTDLTIDLEIGDVTLRLVTPQTEDSPYAPVLAAGPRLCSYALRVADLDAALDALAGVGVPTVRREDGLAATDPAATFGLPIEWTS
jgi:catechol 2,3-dioxygenase-like lactoylglutathione lyase family enzyme